MEMKNLCYITEGDTGGILEAGYDSRGTQKAAGNSGTRVLLSPKQLHGQHTKN